MWYVVWRDTLGQTGTNLAADDNGNSRIDEGDYDVWKSQFNSSVPMSGSIGQVVPEPAAWLMSLVGIGCLVIFPVVKSSRRMLDERRDDATDCRV